jgi:hypothetical protein
MFSFYIIALVQFLPDNYTHHLYFGINPIFNYLQAKLYLTAQFTTHISEKLIPVFQQSDKNPFFLIIILKKKKLYFQHWFIDKPPHNCNKVAQLAS